MTVEVFGAGHLGRDITRRRRAPFAPDFAPVFTAIIAPVFAAHPLGEAIVRHRDVRAAQRRVVAPALAVQLHALAGADVQTVGIGHPQFTAPGACQRRVVIAVEAVRAGALRQQPRFVGDDFRLVGDLA